MDNGGHREGRQGALSSFSASSQGSRSRQRVPSPSDPASEKVVCERDVQAHQARSSPGATQKAGLLTSTTSLAAGEMGMATVRGVDAKRMRPSIQRIYWLDGIGRGRAPHTAHVAYGPNNGLAAFVIVRNTTLIESRGPAPCADRSIGRGADRLTEIYRVVTSAASRPQRRSRPRRLPCRPSS
jgi:hypothetical protein